MRESYRGYLITLDPPPIPSRMADFQFYAYDYDGPGDPRCGFAEDLEAAKSQIDEIELILLDDEAEDDLDDLEFDDLDYIDDDELDDDEPGLPLLKRISGDTWRALLCEKCVLDSAILAPERRAVHPGPANGCAAIIAAIPYVGFHVSQGDAGIDQEVIRMVCDLIAGVNVDKWRKMGSAFWDGVGAEVAT